MMSQGYHLESDTQFQMVWAKEMDNAKGAMAQLIAGNANCAMPKWIVNLTFAPQSDSVLACIIHESGTPSSFFENGTKM